VANPGTSLFTHVNAGLEITYGSPVAPTRQLYMEGTGMWDEEIGLNFHETENRGVRTRIARTPTQTTEDVAINLTTVDGTDYDLLVIAFSMLNGAAVAVGGSADKTWTQTPSMTALNAPPSFTLDAGDDVQNWRLQGCQWQTIKLSAARGDKTSLALTGFAQRAIKTSAAAPVVNSGVKVVSDHWTLKHATSAAGLTGASVVANFLYDWDLEINTGILPRHYLDGNLYIGRSVETDISGTLNLTVESSALAVSEYYDKWKAQTLDFIRLKNTGPVLGGSFYDCQLDLPVYFDQPKVLASVDDGVNLYQIPARLAYDATSAKSIQVVTVTSATALAAA
jgi:hypothetical protein